MPKPRSLDPSNVPDRPNLTTGPSRVTEISEVFKKRIAYIERSFVLGKMLCLTNRQAYNETLSRLRRSLARKRKKTVRGDRIHPETEMVISRFARESAARDGTDVNQDHVEEAAAKALSVLKPRRGRPDNELLDLHVADLMALILETCGTVVVASRTKKSVYSPSFADGASQLVPMFFQDVDPSISVTRLVNSVRKARKEYAGKALRFQDIFPFYGSRLLEAGEFLLPAGWQFKAFEPNIPIYCP